MTPEISVIMSVYNGESYLAEAIESVVSQTFRNWELVVINDCSTDETANILKSFAEKDERIRVFTNEVNLKLPRSLNKAVSLSRGKYVARMDADDICLPDRLEKQYRFMEENSDTDLSSCRFMTLKNGSYASGGCGGRCDDEAIKAMLLMANPILHPGVIAKAEVMKALPYDESLTCTEDLELWCRMAKEKKTLRILPECLLIYRLHDKQITQTTLDRQKSEVLRIQDSYYGATAQKMDEKQKEFYISGIYFRHEPKIEGFLSYAKWLKKSCPMQKSDALHYALFEILAEYKRNGIRKTDVVKAMLTFPPLFLIKETARRKRAAKEDIAKCTKVALSLGLRRTAGAENYPIFGK